MKAIRFKKSREQGCSHEAVTEVGTAYLQRVTWAPGVRYLLIFPETYPNHYVANIAEAVDYAFSMRRDVLKRREEKQKRIAREKAVAEAEAAKKELKYGWFREKESLEHTKVLIDECE